MLTSVRCPQCGTTYQMPPVAIGRYTTCRDCAHRFRVVPHVRAKPAAGDDSDRTEMISLDGLEPLLARPRPAARAKRSPADSPPPLREIGPPLHIVGPPAVPEPELVAEPPSELLTPPPLLEVVWPSDESELYEVTDPPPPPDEDVPKVAVVEEGDEPVSPLPRARWVDDPPPRRVKPALVAGVVLGMGLLLAGLFAAALALKREPSAASADGAKPAPPAGVTVLPFNGPADQVVAAGGGRYLAAHVGQRVLVLDAHTGRVAQDLAAPAPACLLAGGRDVLIAVLPVGPRWGAWRLSDWTYEDRGLLPLAGKPCACALGADSAGPLAVACPDAPPQTEIAFIDLARGELLPAVRADKNAQLVTHDCRLRAAADGSLFTLYSPAHHVGRTFRRFGPRVVVSPAVRGEGSVFTPCADGRFVAAGRFLYDPELRYPYRDRGGDPGPSARVVPAAVGFGTVRFAALRPGIGGDAGLHITLGHSARPVATVERPPLFETPDDSAVGLPLDQRVWLLPGTPHLILLSAAGDRAAFVPFDFDRALASTTALGTELLSKLPDAVTPGQRLAVKLQAWANPGPATFELTTGPPGLTLSLQGDLTWDVPADLKSRQARLNFSVRGQVGTGTGHSTNFRVLAPEGCEVTDTEALTLVRGAPPAAAPPATTARPRRPAAVPPRQPGPTATPPPQDPDPDPAPPNPQVPGFTLPSPATRWCAAAGGRLLCFTLPQARQIAVFDPAAEKIVKSLPLHGDDDLIAGGADHLIVFNAATRTLRRWNLQSFEAEDTRPCPAEFAVKEMALGPASAGPLFLLLTTGSLLTLDPVGFQPLGTADGLPLRMPIHRAGRFAVSGDGDVATYSNAGLWSDSPCVWVRHGSHYRSFAAKTGAAAPGPNGHSLLGLKRQYTVEGRAYQPAEKLTFDNVWRVPAPAGPWLVALHERPANPPKVPWAVRADLHLGTDPRPLGSLGLLPGVPDTLAQSPLRPLDHALVLPEAGKLVIVSPAHDRLFFYPFKPDDLLAGATSDFLFFTSRPPPAARRGTTYRYEAKARGKAGPAALRLDDGPAGLALAADGTLTWDVPAEFAGHAEFILCAADAAGREVFQTVRLIVR